MEHIQTSINRPELTERERAKRMDEIKRAAVELVLANEKKRKEAKQ